ncbi:hypothetical protein [Thermococcus camini]|uniref:Uncharacterized protein n=1 Tax=Thermococcus camini TaxID=2016373 RepID=A0A7G2D6G6_9EURY|nr:hypothetical protein [Thermococcus camini]CAD5244145.1 conserved protein of unknown function [Thermococcus camini]
MRVEIRAVPEDNDPKECIKKVALEALVDEATRDESDFVGKLFSPGLGYRLRECARPKAEVEFSLGRWAVANGRADYLGFVEGLLCLLAWIDGRFRGAQEIANITGVKLSGRVRGGMLVHEFGTRDGAAFEVKDGSLVAVGDGDRREVQVSEVRKEIRDFLLGPFPWDMEELWERYSSAGLGREFLRNTAPVRLLLKVVGYGGKLEVRD